MPTLTRFMDHDQRGRWANLVMDNGDPCWIGIAQTGILVKKSRVGLFGAKLYEEKNLYEAVRTAQALDVLYPEKLTPPEMRNPVLISFVNAVLHCRDLGEFTRVLNEASKIETAAPAADPALLEAQQLVNSYGAVLEQKETLTASEALLPAPKEQIKDALIKIARYANARGASREELDALHVGYASLADFVSEHEARAALTFENVLNASPSQLDHTKFDDLLGKISAAEAAGAFDVTGRNTDEFARLSAEFDQRLASTAAGASRQVSTPESSECGTSSRCRGCGVELVGGQIQAGYCASCCK